MKKISQFEEFDDWDRSRPEACLVCEAMCPDAVDGTLTEGERRAFDKHVAGCAHCAQELEEAQRGAAWLGLLKSGKPEPPATLLTRILAETTGSRSESDTGLWVGSAPPMPPAPDLPAATPVLPPPMLGWVSPAVSAGWAQDVRGPQLLDSALAFRSREPVPAGARSWRGKVLSFRGAARGFGPESGESGLHPRLAMTAAMAFFSIALTLNLTGVHLRDLRAENLQPAALQRSAAEAEATAVRSFQNLRLVYQVESRVSEMRQDPMWDEPAEPAPKAVANTPKQAAATPSPDRN